MWGRLYRGLPCRSKKLFLNGVKEYFLHAREAPIHVPPYPPRDGCWWFVGLVADVQIIWVSLGCRAEPSSGDAAGCQLVLILAGNLKISFEATHNSTYFRGSSTVLVGQPSAGPSKGRLYRGLPCRSKKQGQKVTHTFSITWYFQFFFTETRSLTLTMYVIHKPLAELVFWLVLNRHIIIYW